MTPAGPHTAPYLRLRQVCLVAPGLDPVVADLQAVFGVQVAFRDPQVAAFGLEKSNGELRKQFITPGSVQLNGEKLTDPNAALSPSAGDVLKLSKKHAVRFI